MHLATTALDQYWNKDQKLIFLGDWCITNDSSISNTDYEILPYHWKDLNKAEIDSWYLYNIYESIIPEIANFMNSVHSKTFSQRYWEILIGPWLWVFITNLYDRYLSIKSAINKYENLNTYVTSGIFIPETYKDFVDYIHKDPYNLYLYSQIIKVMDYPINTQIIKNPIKIKSDVNENVFKNNIKNNKINKSSFTLNKHHLLIFIKPIKIIKNSIFSLIGQYTNNYLDLGFALSHKEKKQIYNYLNNIYYDYRVISEINIDTNIDNIIRKKKINIVYNNDEFIELLQKILLFSIPKEYIENYDYILNYYKSVLPKRIPRLLIVRDTTGINQSIRHISALLSENNTKILTTQEGGGHGSRIINIADERVYYELADIGLNWGWESEQKHVKKFGFTKVFWLKQYKRNPKGNILLLGASCRRYFISFSSGQLPSYNDTLVKYNSRLLSGLKPNIFKNIVYRFHWQYGYNEVTKILNKFPNLSISLREDETHFYRLFNNSKLIIITTDFTTVKQSFVANHPTILLWDPNYFTVRKSAKKYYDLLHQAGILYYSPELCSEKINDINENPFEWWMSKKVQEAKNAYCEQFCYIKNDLPLDLAKFIKKEIMI